MVSWLWLLMLDCLCFGPPDGRFESLPRVTYSNKNMKPIKQKKIRRKIGHSAFWLWVTKFIVTVGHVWRHRGILEYGGFSWGFPWGPPVRKLVDREIRWFFSIRKTRYCNCNVTCWSRNNRDSLNRRRGTGESLPLLIPQFSEEFGWKFDPQILC